MKVLRGACWATRPPGLIIFAMPDGVSVESGAQQLLGMRMHRPEPMVLLDEVIMSRQHPSMPPPHRQETRVTFDEARAFARRFKVNTPQGVIDLGAELAAALDEHRLLWREALARGPGLVVAAEPS